MNFEICKKCFELNDNVIQYAFIGHSIFKKNVTNLYIKGLIQYNTCAIETAHCHKCTLHDIEIEKDFKINVHYSTESELKELLKQIKPNKNCKFYTEHMMNYWNEKENNKNEEI